MKSSVLLVILLFHVLWACRVTAAAPGDYWLRDHGLQAHEWDWDHDGDGAAAWEEYYFGTDPRQAASAPPLPLAGATAADIVLTWPSRAGVRYSIGAAERLESWVPAGVPLTGTGGPLTASYARSAGTWYYRLEAQRPLDSDGDTLSGVEEGLLGTNAALADTDSDGLSDGTEIFLTFTNPLVADAPGGKIRGSVRTDPNGDGNAADGVPVVGAEVYLDADYSGDYQSGEPLQTTDAAGNYEFTRLRPGVYQVRQVLAAGQIQTLPAPVASPVLNRLPDEVANYTHGIGGLFPTPYGVLPDPLAVIPNIIVGATVTVDPVLTLKPVDRRGNLPAFGVWTYSEFLSIPQNGSILWRFDEKMVDRAGPDLFIHIINQGADETATLEVGLTPDTLQNAGTLVERAAATTGIPIDFSSLGVTGAVQYVKVTSLTSAGWSPGFDLVGAEAVNFAPPISGSLEVIVTGTETHENKNFARHFRDDPPALFMHVSGADFRAGQSVPVTVQAQDDIGLASLTLTANGAAVPLSAAGGGTVQLPVAGIVDLVATAADSGGQSVREEATVYVNNADGTSPFNSSLTGTGTAGALSLRMVTPHSGQILTGDTPVVVRIEGQLTPQWQLDYAPVGLIDPYNMPAADPDWIPLGSGTGFLMNQSAGVLPVAALPNGIYFLRLRATPSGGGATVYQGQVFAKGVAPEDIQPRVTITSPAQRSTAGLTTIITGSITSTRPLVEWFAEYAPADTVDLNDLGSNTPPWRRFAGGTQTVANATLASLDTSLIPDGSYIVRIVAWNDIRLGWVEPLPLEVAGSVKLGRLRREFTDLKMEVGGIPFQIRRVYDSLDAGKDTGLGYGWSLAFFNPEVRETVADTGSGVFGNTPFREGTRVYLNTPGGTRAGFTFHAEFGVGGLLGAIYKAQFIPDPGVYERLEVPEGDQPFLTIDGLGDAYVSFLGLAWNPSTYILTTPDGLRFTYQEDSGFVEARDKSGNTLTSTAGGLRHSSGAAVNFVRDGQGRITQIQSTGGRTIHYTYNAAGDLAGVTDPDGRTTAFSYYANPAHFLKDVTDPLGRTGTAYEYDAAGRLVAIIDEDGGRQAVTWNPGDFTGTITNRNGHITSLVYNARGNVVSETNALAQTVSYQYNDAANPDKPTARTDGRGNRTDYQYDRFGNATRIVRPADSASATYDAEGRPLTRTSLQAQISTYTYDDAGRLASAAEPGKPLTRYEYTPEGGIASAQVTDPDGRVRSTVWSYNAAGRISGVRDDYGYAAQITMNESGGITNLALPGGRNFAFALDGGGQPTGETAPNGAQTSHTLLPDGTRRSTDRLGRVSDYLISSDQKIEKVTRPGGTVITPGRDGERNVTSLTDASGNTWSYQYDALNRPVRFTDPTGAFSTMGYDAAGNVIETVNRNGRRRTFLYDASDRITHERWHDAGGAVVREFIYRYHFQGYVYEITDGSATWEFGSAPPRPFSVSYSYPGQVRRQVQYGWSANSIAGDGCCGNEGAADELAAPSIITITGGTDFFRTTATYDGPHLIRLEWSTPDQFFGPEMQFLRNASGDLAEVRRYNGQLRSRSTYTWNAMGRMTGASHLDAAGVPLHTDATAVLTRDAASRVTGITRGGDTAGFSYDPQDQLTGVTHTAGAAESYGYNAAGVRTVSHLHPGAVTTGPVNRLLTTGPWSFTYDAEGNTLEKTNSSTGEVTRYSYDHRNQLVLATIHPSAAAPADTTVAFGYDYQGRMMSRALNGAKTWIIYDREMPVAEFADGASSVNAAFLYSPHRTDDFHASWRAGTGVRFFLKDHLGSVLGATDSLGALQYWTGYDAFGNVAGPVPAGMDPIRFTGRFYHAALGLYEMRARFMDPLLGRFTQEDPSGFSGGDINLYRYAGNNPVTKLDPTGLVSAIEYATITDRIGDIETYCSFAKCVAQIWTSMTVSVTTLTPANPPDDNCGVELLGMPQFNLQSVAQNGAKYLVQQALSGSPAGLALGAYLATKVCDEYVNALPGGGQP